MDEPLLWLGTLLCALAAAAGLVPVLRRRIRLAALTLGVALAPVLVLADSWDSSRIADLRDRPALLLVAAIAATAGIVIGGWIFRRRPTWLAPALVAAMPFRIPIDLGGGDANLLLPLYAVIACGLAATLYGAWRDPAPEPAPSAQSAQSAQSDRRGWWLGAVGWALAGVVVLYALQAAYADDITRGLQNVAFFLAPFAALYLLLAEARWDRRGMRAIVWVLAIEGLVFLLVGAAEYASGELLWNDKVISGNEAHTYFRVNSLFWDPNILGRYLAVTMTVLAAIVAYGRRPSEVRGAAACFALFLVLLVVSYSQTSTLALLAALLVLVAARWGVTRGIGAGAATLVALVAAVVLIAGGGLSSETTSGRAGLIDGGLEIARDHPVVGLGSGGFADEFTARYYEGEGFAAESHTEPVTVAAEQGIVGLLAYAGLLVVSFGALLSATGLELRKRARGTALAATLLAVYALMFVHSLGYAAFLIDPITWAVLAIAGAALLPAPRPSG
ncbi:MAG TPA: O-antigen ligase family protein [Solirubrobacterales bacterium]|nr:O-antigen ligase family protein [Solirubrobacterales bacterium]